jgi:DNA-binding IclR family transcriptional regulator
MATVGLVTEIGVRLPAHLTAVGRAILAELPEAQVRALYANQPLVKRTGHGPTSVDALLRDLEAVRGRGVAHDAEMVTPGISCIAAPVFSHEGVPAAAVGITFVSAQRTAEDIAIAAEVVREISGRLSRSLGHPGADVRSVAV